MKRLLRAILDLLFPPKCSFCGKLIPSEYNGICEDCKVELKYRGCLAAPPLSIDSWFSALEYSGIARRAVINYKFNGRISYCRTFAGIISKIINDNALKCDIITWVPLSKKRKRKRGYDQAEMIARELSKLTGKPCVRLLVKTVNNSPQTKTSGAEERKLNVSGVYAAVEKNIPIDSSIILIDDVITTGATVSECSGVLKKAGVGHITAVSVAKTPERTESDENIP